MIIPVIAEERISELQTLLASPTHAIFRSRVEPKCSQIVRISARIWQGCSRSESPLITGICEIFSKINDRLVLIGPDHNPGDISRCNPGGIPDFFSPPDLEVLRIKIEGMPAQVVHADFEGKSRPRRRFFKYHGEGFPGQQLSWGTCSFLNLLRCFASTRSSSSSSSEMSRNDKRSFFIVSPSCAQSFAGGVSGYHIAPVP